MAPGYSQIDQASLPHVGRDELGRRLDRGQEQREVTGRGGPQAELVVEDVPADRGPLIIPHAVLAGHCVPGEGNNVGAGEGLVRHGVVG